MLFFGNKTENMWFSCLKYIWVVKIFELFDKKLFFRYITYVWLNAMRITFATHIEQFRSISTNMYEEWNYLNRKCNINYFLFTWNANNCHSKQLRMRKWNRLIYNCIHHALSHLLSISFWFLVIFWFVVAANKMLTIA